MKNDFLRSLFQSEKTKEEIASALEEREREEELTNLNALITEQTETINALKEQIADLQKKNTRKTLTETDPDTEEHSLTEFFI